LSFTISLILSIRGENLKAANKDSISLAKEKLDEVWKPSRVLVLSTELNIISCSHKCALACSMQEPAVPPVIPPGVEFRRKAKKIIIKLVSQQFFYRMGVT